jgi:hypothetical protein
LAPTLAYFLRFFQYDTLDKSPQNRYPPAYQAALLPTHEEGNMSETENRKRSNTGLRLADLNKTYPPINGVVETSFATALRPTVVEDIERNFFETIGESRVTIWFINATAGHDLSPDATFAMGQFVARVKERGCRRIILVSSNDLLIMRMRTIMIPVHIRPDTFSTREEADAKLDELRRERDKEAM